MKAIYESLLYARFPMLQGGYQNMCLKNIKICFSRPLAISSQTSREMLLSPTKYRNPNNTIRVALAYSFTAKLHLFS